MSQLDDEEHRLCVYTGWWPLLDTLHRQALMVDPGYEVFQVKEKWARLRVSLTASGTIGDEGRHDRSLILRALCESAEERSGYVCELCGDLGALRRFVGGWYKTFCDRCNGIPSAPPGRSEP